jgi:hypothetical protein
MHEMTNAGDGRRTEIFIEYLPLSYRSGSDRSDGI